MVTHPLLARLPGSLLERTRLLRDGEPARAADFVLYWMCTALRAHENPALDVAITWGNALGLPVLVYQALSERYRYASDRHHTFILEGARDVAAELTHRKVASAFHLERPGHRGTHLLSLAAQAALVVTEDFPVEPIRTWTETLVRHAPVPVLAVDTACVLPMQVVGKAYDRAFAFRSKTEGARHKRAVLPWPEVEPTIAARLPALPFAPIDLACADVPALVAACAIDHGVAPVPETRGGSIAGYQRWETFKATALRAYSKARNDPARDGVSRMSAYLHHGMVSPFRLAREAFEVGGDGAHKYLDELLIWRELAYVWCRYTHAHEGLAALPAWAQETLQAHAADPREALISWEQMARGRTGDPLWDACQRSLLAHGELHNNVRMTWGKRALSWTASPAAALARIVDLNHRYALDGRDPASSGGLLWCLGQFDRPFEPATPVTGTVRPRSSRDHAARVDLAAFQRKVARKTRSVPQRVAVIGAGMAGLFCARTLADHNVDVQVFDKGRGVGGRLSTRRADPFQFDHGAQYFTAHDEAFRRHVESWTEDGHVAPWNGRFATLKDGHSQAKSPHAPRYVGTPDMNAVARHLAADLHVRSGAHVNAIHRGATWTLALDGSERLDGFDAVVLAVPGPQAAVLLAPIAPTLASRATAAPLSPAWALMLGYATPLGLPFDAAQIEEAPVAWAARQGSRPGRADREAWVVHASRAWSRAHLELTPEEAAHELQDAFERAVGQDLPAPVHAVAHRWRYALAEGHVDGQCLWDPDLGLGACGDWCVDGRVEAAFVSGAALAGRLLALAQPLALPPADPGRLGPLFEAR